AVSEILSDKYHIDKPEVVISSQMKSQHDTNDEQKQKEQKEEVVIAIEAQEPQFTFDQIILSPAVLEELNYSIHFEKVRDKVYKEWGLLKIEPSPKLALNFHGDSGTGKTMAAHAIANAMGKKIILASYAEIESKYHGDGPKNVKKLFQLAEEQNALLFIDEADSLLSRRLTNVTQGSEQAINSMRSQLLIQIEQFSGTVVFATNLASNYDSAFVTRIRSVHFEKPDLEMRKKLWNTMLLPTLPLDKDIDINRLSSIDDICGRDVKNAIVKAAVKTAIDGETSISHKSIENAIKSIIESNSKVSKNLSKSDEKRIVKKIKTKLHKSKNVYKKKRSKN
ncbi:MAG: AAA family ATPase, partial [Endomicrobium sp.]|nr:AAA family ATPase [Endomicrobium sp.]